MDRTTLTLNDEAFASNPGRIRVSYCRWLIHYPKWPLIWAIAFSLFAFLAFQVSLFFLVGAVVTGLINLLYWIRIKEHFMHGCVNPGIVIRLAPLTIAVATDLSKGEGVYPAVKIFESKLLRVMGQHPAVGTRLATVALYSPGEDNPAYHWGDFHPIPADAATGDQEQLLTVMASIEDEEWRMLDRALNALHSADLGLHHVRGIVW